MKQSAAIAVKNIPLIGLREVARSIDLTAFLLSYIVCVDLKRNNAEQRCDLIQAIRDVEGFIRMLLDCCIALLGDGDYMGVASLNLLYIRYHLVKELRLCCKCNDYCLRLHQCNGSVLELSDGNSKAENGRASCRERV